MTRTRILAPGLVILLGACAQPPMTLPGPLEFERSPRSAAATIAEASGPRAAPDTAIATMPSPRLKPTATPPAPPPTTALAADDEEVSMAIEQTPLPMFIQILYGNVLRKPYSIDPAVTARTDFVTFKTSRPIPRSRLAELAVTLLASYQVTVQDLDGLIRILPANSPNAAASPTLRFGKTLPQTPEALRTAFHYVELDVVKAADIAPVLRQVLGNRLTYQEVQSRNAFLLSGTQNDLRIALDLIAALDQPRMRGSVARRLTPAYLNATELSSRLVEVLSAQGYAIGTGAASNTPIVLVPIPVIGSVMAFANDETSMEMVLRWTRELDRPIIAQTQNGIYTYPVKYADAQDLARTLSDVLGSGGGIAPAAPSGIQPAGTTAATAAPRPSSSSGGRVVVNNATNTLIIRGSSADEYQQIQTLLRELDRPVKSAMIEVVVAELALGASSALGIEWNVPTRSVNGGRGLATAGTLGRLGIGSSGFLASYGNTAGQILAQLNVLASNNQARILSNPKVMARNGETASIQVGQEVPVVTSQQSSATGGLLGGTAVVNQISYRSTGVILRVRPVINSGNRLDLDVSQEVSSAAETRTGVSASPTISTRRIDTKLSLRDGSTVLLGGLISRTSSDANTGIPWLKDIPTIGALFRTQSESNNQTELLIMITPYVINDDFEAEAITEAIQKSFGGWAQDIKTKRVVERPTGDPVPLSGQAVPAANANALQTPPLFAPSPAVPKPPSAAQQQADPARTPLSNSNAPAPASAERGEQAPTDGVTMSKPSTAQSTQVPPADGAQVKPATGPAGSPLAADPGSRPPAALGRPVTDEKIKKEIEEMLKNRK